MASINSLHQDKKNARKRTDRSSTLIEESITRYGAARSIVIDEENRILAGNGTVEGAKAAGLQNVRIIESDGDEIIAIRRSGLTEEQKVGLALADNRTSDLSDWDHEMLHTLSQARYLQLGSLLKIFLPSLVIQLKHWNPLRILMKLTMTSQLSIVVRPAVMSGLVNPHDR